MTGQHFRIFGLTLALAGVWSSVADAAPKDPRPKVAVMGVSVQSASLEPGMAGTLEILIVDALNSSHRFIVTGRSDMGAILSLEAQKQALGCESDANCMAEIAAALGVDYVLTASVGKIGNKLILRAGLVDVKAQRAVAASNRKLSDVSAIADEIDPWIGDLVKEWSKLPAANRPPPPPAHPGPDAPAATQPAPPPTEAERDTLLREEEVSFGLRPGLVLLGASNLRALRWSAYALATLDLGPRWTLAVGAHVAPAPSGQISVERRLVLAGPVELRAALRALLTSTSDGLAWGGGGGLVARLPLTSHLDLQAGLAADALLSSSASLWAPYAELGLRGHL